MDALTALRELVACEEDAFARGEWTMSPFGDDSSVVDRKTRRDAAWAATRAVLNDYDAEGKAGDLMGRYPKPLESGAQRATDASGAQQVASLAQAGDSPVGEEAAGTNPDCQHRQRESTRALPNSSASPSNHDADAASQGAGRALAGGQHVERPLQPIRPETQAGSAASPIAACEVCGQQHVVRPIFSCEDSRQLWSLINATPAEAGDALYKMGCSLQELESRIEHLATINHDAATGAIPSNAPDRLGASVPASPLSAATSLAPANAEHVDGPSQEGAGDSAATLNDAGGAAVTTRPESPPGSSSASPIDDLVARLRMRATDWRQVIVDREQAANALIELRRERDSALRDSDEAYKSVYSAVNDAEARASALHKRLRRYVIDGRMCNECGGYWPRSEPERATHHRGQCLAKPVEP